MYISVKELEEKWQVRPTSIIHVGAHEGEEFEAYRSQGWIGFGNQKAILVEAQPSLAELLKARLPSDLTVIVNRIIHEDDNQYLTLNVASNSQSSSIFDFNLHKSKYPEISFVEKKKVLSSRLDSILREQNLSPDFINLDIQGAELIALKSLGERITQFKWIYTEVNFEELYQGTGLVGDIDTYLRSNSFKRVYTYKRIGAGWGDALYIREDVWKSMGLKRVFLSIHSKCKLITDTLKEWKLLIVHHLKNIFRKTSKTRRK